MAQVMKTYFASVISEIEQSDIYLTIKARLFEAPKPNLNGVRVTYEFINEIVDNEDKYIGLPLCADVKNLANGNYERLGHLYDSRTGEFHSTQIGSFYKYEKEDFEEGTYLIGYARVMKRNKAICKALAELFAEGKLKFSFEISCGEYKKLPDDTIEIDACEGNFLEGAAVVSLPACEDAIALELVAEAEKIAEEINDDKKGDCDMADVINNINTNAIAEENAELIVTQTHCEHDSVRTYDTETNTEVVQSVDTYVEVREIAETNDDGEITAESSNKKTDDLTVDPEDIEETEEDPDTSDETAEVKKETEEVEEDDENASCKKEKAEEDVSEKNEETASYEKKIAELIEEINNLKHEIAELKTQQETENQRIREIAEKTQNVNPFMASISVEDKHNKFRLLEPVEKRTHYSLLD